MSASNAADRRQATVDVPWREAPDLPSTAGTTVIVALADSAPVAIDHADGTGRLPYGNPPYRTMLGLAPRQDLNDWPQGVHPHERRRMEEAWADFCRSPRAAQFQWRPQSRAGEVRFLTEAVVPVARAGAAFTVDLPVKSPTAHA